MLLTAFGLLLSLDDHVSEFFNETGFGAVEVWQRDRESKAVSEPVGLVFDGAAKGDEVVEHDECALC